MIYQSQLSPPSTGKAGWPWTEETHTLPPTLPDGSPWPKVSIVTPSFNQGQFIEETIRSVLLQGYPNLEYIIIDGASTDNSVEIIRKQEKHIADWVSEKDKGQADAINKGWRRGHVFFFLAHSYTNFQTWIAMYVKSVLRVVKCTILHPTMQT